LEAPGIVCDCKELLGNIFKGFKQIIGGLYATLESVIPKDEESGRSRTSDVYRAPDVGLRAAKGKTFSSNTMSREIYIRPVEISRYL
jgi:hypothetical protein